MGSVRHRRPSMPLTLGNVSRSKSIFYSMSSLRLWNSSHPFTRRKWGPNFFCVLFWWPTFGLVFDVNGLQCLSYWGMLAEARGVTLRSADTRYIVVHVPFVACYPRSINRGTPRRLLESTLKDITSHLPAYRLKGAALQIEGGAFCRRGPWRWRRRRASRC